MFLVALTTRIVQRRPLEAMAAAALGTRGMAKKMSSGKSRNRQGPGPKGKRRGVKKFEGEWVEPGNVLVKQLGLAWKPGLNVMAGQDHTLHALVRGQVRFTKRLATSGRCVGRRQVTVVNVAAAPALPKPLVARKILDVDDPSALDHIPINGRLTAIPFDGIYKPTKPSPDVL